jgi:glutamine synthetase
MPLSTDVEELRAGGVALVAGSITDLAGVTRAKYVPLRRLESFQRSGMGVSPSWSVFCVDSGIAFTENIGVDGDLRIRIDPADLRVIDDGIAWAPGDLTNQDGTAAALCTRSLLASVESALRAKGLTALVGAELEATMLSPDVGHATNEPWSPYGVRTSLDRSAFLVDLAAAAERAQLPVEQIHTEYGHDQIEVSLAPDTPVAAVDTVAATRMVIGRVAARHGLRISFSPVPFEGEAGNGAHLHMSLADDDGPLFSGGQGPHGMRTAGESAIAGVLQTLPDLLGVYAGSVLSAARLKPGNWAGAAQCWGLENREAAVRFVAATPGTPHGANVELKLIDPSANPYLAAVSLLGSALNGIERGLDLPAEVPKDPSKAAQPPTMLQTDQQSVIKALETSPVAAQLLTPAVIEGLVAVRRYEIATFGDRPLAETAKALRLAWSC